MKTFNKAIDKLTTLFPKNLILWRDANFSDGRTSKLVQMRIDDCPFVQTDRKSWMAKIQLVGQWVNGPAIVPATCRGVTVFLMDQPPENWTHLLVTGVSKSLKEGAANGCVFATAAKPYNDYEAFRLAMFKWNRRFLNVPFKSKVIAAMTLHPSERRAGQIRLVTDYDRPGILSYHHLIEAASGIAEHYIPERGYEGRSDDSDVDTRRVSVA